ncbi:hypothetical protein BT69DRAFT_1282830 [Atractiella rhizophila]|nr:hypothetical protein BT69DRAFT_1282830 [Atractiella rhizophila]
MSQSTNIKCIKSPQILEDSPADYTKFSTEWPTESQIYDRVYPPKIRPNISLTGFDTRALGVCASRALSIQEVPVDITLAHNGFWNRIFCIKFSSGKSLLVRIPSKHGDVPERTESVVASMTFGRAVLGLPTNPIRAWNNDRGNPVKAPYILMDALPGEEAADYWSSWNDEKKITFLANLARLMSACFRPLPYNRFGNLYFNRTSDCCDLTNPLCYEVGSFLFGPHIQEFKGLPPATGSTETIQDLWLRQLEVSSKFVRAHCSLEDSNAFLGNLHPQYDETTVSHFLAVESALRTLLLKFGRNMPSFAEPALVFQDFAMRNILVNPDTAEITGIVDFDDVSILPRLLSSTYPEEICSFSRDNTWRQANGSFIFLPPDVYPTSDFYLLQAKQRILDPLFRDSNLDPSSWCTEVKETKFRKWYDGFLQTLSPEMDDDFRELRRYPLKLHDLSVKGWRHWLDNDSWILLQRDKHSTITGF